MKAIIALTALLISFGANAADCKAVAEEIISNNIYFQQTAGLQNLPPKNQVIRNITSSLFAVYNDGATQEWEVNLEILVYGRGNELTSRKEGSTVLLDAVTCQEKK
jgi:hypothetical protein